MSVLSLKIFRQEAKFIAGASSVMQLPRLFLFQAAFIGKSNVGKSSLINKLCNRRALARVSHTPGRTQQINFFSLGDKFILVDLPGYGYAKVSDKMRKNWEELIVHYLTTEERLGLVNVLVDARRGVQNHDIEVMQLLKNAGKVFQVVFTKIDKVKEVENLLSDTRDILLAGQVGCDIVVTSSRNGYGYKELQASILNHWR
jgi:GTP-binding protein